MRLMSLVDRHRIRASVALALATSVAAGCGGAQLIPNDVAPLITEGVASQVGIKLARVTCPAEPRPAVANDTFECIGEGAEGGRLTLAVTQTDDEGSINWKVTKTEGLIDLKKAETAVVDGFKQQLGVAVKVDCGGKYKAVTVGGTFECRASADDGSTADIVVEMTDAEGNIHWKTKR